VTGDGDPLGKLIRLAADDQELQPLGKLQQLVEAEHSQRMAHGRRLAMHPDFAAPEDVQTAIDALSRDLVRYGLAEGPAKTYATQLVAKARRDVSAQVTKPAAKKTLWRKLPIFSAHGTGLSLRSRVSQWHRSLCSGWKSLSR
jgi:hypothetical protein